jgi:hypothetical protein
MKEETTSFASGVAFQLQKQLIAITNVRIILSGIGPEDTLRLTLLALKNNESQL